MVHTLHVRHVHVRVIHAAHAAVIHAHIRHGQQRRGAQSRNRALHARSWCQSATRIARAAHGFGKQRIGLIFLRLHYDVVGFRDTNAQLINLYWLHVVAIGLHHRHFQARQTHIKVGHRG